MPTDNKIMLTINADQSVCDTESLQNPGWELTLSDLRDKLAAAPKSKKAAIEKAIADAEFRLEEIAYMGKLAIADWVRCDMHSRPGQITELGYSGKVPQAMVQWWGDTVSLPARPLNLTKLKGKQLLYCWTADQFPKLISRLDREECSDRKILQKKLKEYQEYLIAAQDAAEEVRGRSLQLQVNYLEKRLAVLELNHPHNDGSKNGIASVIAIPTLINISEIKRDRILQQRVQINHETVVEYAIAMRNGDRFPPVKLTYDGTSYWLTDGYHTTEAAYSIGKTEIEAIVTEGTLRDAILESVGVNATHGLKRTNADKRRAVTKLLEDEEWKQWSDREISRRCKVDHKTVGKIRHELTGDFPSDTIRNDNQIITGEFPSDNLRKYKDKHGNVSEMNVENIGEREVNELELRPSARPQRADGGQLELNSSFRAAKSSTDNGSDSTDKQSGVQIRSSVKDFQVGQIVQIVPSCDRPDKRLVGYKNAIALVTAVNPATVDLVIWGKTFAAVSPNDLKILDQNNLPVICFSFNHLQYRCLLEHFDSKEQALEYLWDKVFPF